MHIIFESWFWLHHFCGKARLLLALFLFLSIDSALQPVLPPPREREFGNFTFPAQGQIKLGKRQWKQLTNFLSLRWNFIPCTDLPVTCDISRELRGCLMSTRSSPTSNDYKKSNHLYSPSLKYFAHHSWHANCITLTFWMIGNTVGHGSYDLECGLSFPTSHPSKLGFEKLKNVVTKKRGFKFKHPKPAEQTARIFMRLADFGFLNSASYLLHGCEAIENHGGCWTFLVSFGKWLDNIDNIIYIFRDIELGIVWTLLFERSSVVSLWTLHEARSRFASRASALCRWLAGSSCASTRASLRIRKLWHPRISHWN